MSAPPLKDPTAFLPLVISLFCLAMVIGHAATYGLVQQADEGAAARIFQLLMLVQVPIVAWFAMKWLPSAPKQASVILVLQVAAGATAIASVIILEHFSRRP